ncbi:tannase/feruloyl esterase family alpha/beta hydrolase [Bacillus sp. JJ634]
MKSKLKNLILFPLLSFVFLLVCSLDNNEVYTQDRESVCSNLKGVSIPASRIGLPTNGATVQSATFVWKTGKYSKNRGFCKVLGAIHPVDKNAPDIHFQVNLPVNWNHKLLQVGGGAFDGVLVTGLGASIGKPLASPDALSKGYVTFGSDSGHQGKSLDGSFALNDEALANFASDQLKKTKDVALELVGARYHSKPSQVYFFGRSNGGREALKVVQRFPTEYDGVIVLYPALNWISKAIKDNQNANALYANNGAGWISPAENKLINETVLNVCDSLDGVADGIVSHITACAKKSNHILNFLSKHLSKEKVDIIKLFNSPLRFNYPLANGLTVTPGYSQLQGANISESRLSQYGTSPLKRKNFVSRLGDGVIKYMVVRDKDFNPVHFNPDQWKDQIVKASQLLDATDPNLSKFKDSGGKLILLHGTADQIVTPYSSIDYYDKLVDKFGKSSLDQFVQFYLVPGYGHRRSETFTMRADLLGALDTWVVDGKRPVNLVAQDQNANTFGRTRPLCEYPTYPKYKGKGNVNSAANFTCATP